MTLITVILSIFLVGAIFYIVLLCKRIPCIEKDEMKKMEQRRSGFISIVSHQLRTPLSVIKGYLEAVTTGDQGALNDGQKEYLNDALKISKDTIKLVNDYLDAVQLDSENIPVNPKSTDLVAITKEIVARMQILAKAYNCELEFLEPTTKLPPVVADPIKIQQVIENIVANAVKYTSGRGSAKVTLKQKDNAVIFECRDTGVGIPADQQPQLFTKFFRAKNILQKDTKGSGLGLYFAKMIIEALGGKIWVKSVEERGTVVSFQLLNYSSKIHEQTT
jgi:signal transduction histidine kinase